MDGKKIRKEEAGGWLFDSQQAVAVLTGGVIPPSIDAYLMFGAWLFRCPQAWLALHHFCSCEIERSDGYKKIHYNCGYVYE
jgi:hypothetical protein